MLQNIASCERYCHEVFMSCKLYGDLVSQWPAMLQIDEPRTLIIAEHFFDRFISWAVKNSSDTHFYCRGCESFLTSVEGFVVDRSHPEADLVKLSDFLAIFEIKTHQDFYRWMKTHLRVPMWGDVGSFEMLKMPGLDRYHLSFRGNTLFEHSHQPHDYATINLRLNLAIKDNTIERMQSELYSLHVELLDLRSRLESMEGSQSKTRDNRFVNEFFRQQAELNGRLRSG